MKLFSTLLDKLIEKGADYAFEKLKLFIIPAPLTLLAYIHSIEKFIINNPFMIYIIFFIPAFFVGLFSYLLLQSKVKNSKLKAEITKLTTYEPMFNVLWDTKCNPYSTCCKKYLDYHFYDEGKKMFHRDDFTCPNCNKKYWLRDTNGNQVKYSDAKKIIQNFWMLHKS